MPYSGDPASSDTDYVRYKLGDTVAPYRMTDEEIQFELDQAEGNRDLAVLKCADATLATLSKLADYSIGPEKVSASQRYKQFLQIRDKLFKDAGMVTAIPIGGPLPGSEPIFDIGMTDNKEANYGPTTSESCD